MARAKAEPASSSLLGATLAGSHSLWLEAQSKIRRLTKREREVLALVAEGLSSKEIGAALGISCRTSELHRGSVLKKLGARSATEMARLAVYASLAERLCNE